MVAYDCDYGYTYDNNCDHDIARELHRGLLTVREGLYHNSPAKSRKKQKIKNYTSTRESDASLRNRLCNHWGLCP